MKNTELTAKEREFLNNLDKIERGTNFGTIQVKSYRGKSSTLGFLNLLKDEQGTKYIGSTSFVREGDKDFWYLYAIDGETYRIPEPAEGIDEFFDMEFKRNNV